MAEVTQRTAMGGDFGARRRADGQEDPERPAGHRRRHLYPGHDWHRAAVLDGVLARQRRAGGRRGRGQMAVHRRWCSAPAAAARSSARSCFPDLPELAFVEMGGIHRPCAQALRLRGIAAGGLSGMIGKLSKVAQGHFMTHVAGNKVGSCSSWRRLALEAGASPNLAERVRGANTARHVQEMRRSRRA